MSLLNKNCNLATPKHSGFLCSMSKTLNSKIARVKKTYEKNGTVLIMTGTKLVGDSIYVKEKMMYSGSSVDIENGISTFNYSKEGLSRDDDVGFDRNDDESVRLNIFRKGGRI